MHRKAALLSKVPSHQQNQGNTTLLTLSLRADAVASSTELEDSDTVEVGLCGPVVQICCLLICLPEGVKFFFPLLVTALGN